MSAVDFDGFDVARSSEIVEVARLRAGARERRIARLDRTIAVLVTAVSIVSVGVMIGLGL